MSVTATPPARDSESRVAPVRTLNDRISAALPLTSVYVGLCFVFMIEAWNRVTPWLFTDELELTQLSRSIAATGHAARRGQPHSANSLYTYLTAPLWLIHEVAKAYAAIKYVDVFVMASVVFPTYFLARLIVGRGPALFAAAGAGAIPSLAYSSYILEENLAYPWAALCFFLIAKALVVRRRGRRGYGWGAAAVITAAIAPAVKGELVVIPLALVLAVLFALWSSDRERTRRKGWSRGDWVGAVTLALGAIFFVSGFVSHHYYEWYVVTTYYQHRILVMGNWASGALAIGLGVIPLIGGLAALVPAPGEERSRELRMFRCVALGGLIGVGLYASMKAAYLSTVFATRVEERNLIYVAPLLFVGTALILDRRRVNFWALLGATVYAGYLVGYAIYHTTQFPYEMNVQLYSDSLGLAILQQANRFLRLTPAGARGLLLAIVVLGAIAFLVLPRLQRRARAAGALVAVLALFVVAWNLTGEISAAAGSNSISRTAAATLRRPFDWVDSIAQRRPTLYLGEGEADQNPEWMLEFWNRSISSVTSLDGTIGGPGPAGAPNETRTGVLYWSDDPSNPGPGFDYAVEDRPCVDLAGTYRGRHYYRAGGRMQVWYVIQLTHPNRLLSQCTGIYPDGWSGAADSIYYRFASAGKPWLRVVVSRRAWSGPTGPSPVQLRVGTVIGNANHQPQIGHVTKTIDLTIDSTQTKVCWVRPPSAPYAATVIVANKFIPHQIDPKLGDPRVLGAEVSYDAVSSLPAGAKPDTCG